MQKIKKILLSQPKPANEKSPYFDIEKNFSLKIDFKPFIKVEPIAAKEFRQQKVNIQEHTAVVFTAKTAIDHFFRMCGELRITVSDDLKYFCITEQVALYLQKYIQYRKRKIFFGTGTPEDLADAISKHTDEKFLVVLSDVHDANKNMDRKKDIIDCLEENGVAYTKAIMYRTVSTDLSKEPDFNYDMMVFFSPSGINSLYENFPKFEQGNVKIGCMGSTTQKYAQSKGLEVNIAAPSPENPSMSDAINNYLKAYNKK